MVVPVVAIDLGPTIVATEDMGRDNRIFYPMQAQVDTFSISAVFTTKQDSNTFNRWIWRYVEFVSAGMGMAVGLRVQCPARNFDFMGFPTQGWSYHFAPLQLTDWSWVVTINFDGAAPTNGQLLPVSGGNAWSPPVSSYHSALFPPDPDALAFYPGYYTNNGNPAVGPPNGKQLDIPNGVKNPAKN
jgi:hypothetical protein